MHNRQAQETADCLATKAELAKRPLELILRDADLGIKTSPGVLLRVGCALQYLDQLILIARGDENGRELKLSSLEIAEARKQREYLAALDG